MKRKYTVWITTFDAQGNKELDTYDCESWGHALDTIKAEAQNHLGSSAIQHPNGNIERIK